MTRSSYRPRERRPHSDGARPSVRAHPGAARAGAASPSGAPVRPPSIRRQAETLLDELARHDDRLLRDNEPRIEGAAKTMLTDWTRRRILSFVPPPKERLGDKNKKVTREEKRKAITDVTDNPVITVEEQGKE
jgi:hypothetical protein